MTDEFKNKKGKARNLNIRNLGDNSQLSQFIDEEAEVRCRLKIPLLVRSRVGTRANIFTSGLVFYPLLHINHKAITTHIIGGKIMEAFMNLLALTQGRNF